MNEQLANLLYVFERGPYSNASGAEGLEAALIGAAFEQKVSLLFVHDGVFQLKAGQSAVESELKQYTKTFAAFEDFGVSDVFVHDFSLVARGLSSEDLQIKTSVVTAEQIAQLIQQQQKVFTF